VASLKDQLQALESHKPRNFKDWLKVADPEERELVLSYIHSTVPAAKLASTLNGNGIPVTRETIVKMRDDSRG
jgi:hypothetical protein